MTFYYIRGALRCLFCFFLHVIRWIEGLLVIIEGTERCNQGCACLPVLGASSSRGSDLNTGKLAFSAAGVPHEVSTIAAWTSRISVPSAGREARKGRRISKHVRFARGWAPAASSECPVPWAYANCRPEELFIRSRRISDPFHTIRGHPSHSSLKCPTLHALHAPR